MNEQRILEELLEILEANGVTIRHEPLGGGAGGLCVIKGQKIFFHEIRQIRSAVSWNDNFRRESQCEYQRTY